MDYFILNEEKLDEAFELKHAFERVKAAGDIAERTTTAMFQAVGDMDEVMTFKEFVATTNFL